MLVDKSYQASADLQAFPNITNTSKKVILYINQRLILYYKGVITLKMIATAVGVTTRQISTILKELVELRLITKSRRRGHYNDINKYTITAEAKKWMPYLVNSYKVFCGIFKKSMLSVGLLLSLSSSSFTLLKEDIYIYPPLKRELLTHAHAKRVAMSTPIDAKEMLAAQDLLSLSKWGMIRLSAYPRQAIEHAYLSFRNSKSKKDDPFKWFCSICDEWCRKQNAEPNLPYMRRLAIEHEMPTDAVWIVARPVLAIPEKGKRITSERREPMTEEQGFISRIQFVDKALNDPAPNEFMRILQAGFMKEIQPYLEKPDDTEHTIG